MLQKLCLVAIALLGVTALSGCQTPKGGSPGGSCAAGQSTYAAPSQGGYMPSQSGSGSRGGSGSR